MTTTPNKKGHHLRGSTGMDIPRSAAQHRVDVASSGQLAKTLAQAETRSVSILRLAVLSTLLMTAAVVSAGVYLYTRNEERHNFTSHFEDSAQQVVESFHDVVERNLGAVGSLSTDFTSYALRSNSSFPFVTLPDFALKGSHFRAQSGSHIVHWLPLVTDENRAAWEKYANETRRHVDEEFELDAIYRAEQDEALLGNNNRKERKRILEKEEEEDPTTAVEAEAVNPPKRPMTVLQDGTGFHSTIWSNGAVVPPGDEPEGSGPFLPTWQRSPISGKRQAFLNMNWVHAKVIGPGLLDTMLQEKKAILRNVARPIPKFMKELQANLAISQYRENVDDYIDGLSTFLAYPVFDKFGDGKRVAGVLATNVYWKILLSHLLPSSSVGIVVCVENSFNQSFAYRIDGSEATFLGMGDFHEDKYDDMEVTENVNEYLQQRASPRNRAYATVPMSDTSQYTIRVYPSQDTEDQFVTYKPIVYTVVVLFGFAFASVLFLLFSFVVEKRQHIMINQVVENAERVTATERELNEFLAHEVRNPLAAAISASSFVTSALYENQPLKDEETRKFVREDMEVVNSSLNFINDFLRSMLDIHRANDNKITIQKAPTDLLRDIFEPVSAILHKRVANFEVIVDCPENLIVQTDCIRLKQVVLNLVRNSSKFVEKGFIRMRANVVDHQVRLYVEDSGVGIPEEKRKELFAKYQLSLDLLSQGTGLGLNLSKKLMLSMGGEIWLDEDYHSGIEGCVGACFVLQLNDGPIDIEATLQTERESSEFPISSTDKSSSQSSMQVKEVPTEAYDDEPTQPPAPANALFSIPLAPPASDSSPPEDIENPNSSTQQNPCSLFAIPPPAQSSIVPNLPPPPTSPPSAAALPLAEEKPKDELPTDLAVLFVDDDAVLRKLFMRAVRKVAPSWKIQEAASGEAALKLCEEQDFTLIFLDQYMASVDKQLLGTETAQAMRSRGIKSTICGLSANDIRDSFLSSGANDFLLKPMPCKPDSLREVLSKILQMHNNPTSQ